MGVGNFVIDLFGDEVWTRSNTGLVPLKWSYGDHNFEIRDELILKGLIILRGIIMKGGDGRMPTRRAIIITCNWVEHILADTDATPWNVRGETQFESAHIAPSVAGDYVWATRPVLC
jgi:hypothetical protein